MLRNKKTKNRYIKFIGDDKKDYFGGLNVFSKVEEEEVNLIMIFLIKRRKKMTTM